MPLDVDVAFQLVEKLPCVVYVLPRFRNNALDKFSTKGSVVLLPWLVAWLVRCDAFRPGPRGSVWRTANRGGTRYNGNVGAGNY